MYDIENYIDVERENNLCPFLRNMAEEYQDTYEEYQHSLIGRVRRKTEAQLEKSRQLGARMSRIADDFDAYMGMMENINKIDNSEYMSIVNLPTEDEYTEVDKLFVDYNDSAKKIYESDKQVLYSFHRDILHMNKRSDDSFVVYYYDSTLDSGYYSGANEIDSHMLLIILAKLKEKGWISDDILDILKKGEFNNGSFKSPERNEEAV